MIRFWESSKYKLICFCVFFFSFRFHISKQRALKNKLNALKIITTKRKFISSRTNKLIGKNRRTKGFCIHSLP